MVRKAITPKINEYERKEVVSSTQYINISEHREVDLKTIFDKLEQEIKKRKDKLQTKGSNMNSVTFGSINISASMYVKRLETDAEYNKRIANYEKQQEVLRKKEEAKIKREFKNLQELQAKFENVSSEEEAVMKSRMEKASKNIISIKE